MVRKNITNTNRQDLLMYSLTKFFCDENYTQKLLDILNVLKGKDKISLRIIDWFVTNYSKKYNINYPVTVKNHPKKQFTVYLDYKSQLKAFSKKQFDPFCRRDRIMFYYVEGKHITTTVGQLNFFRWAIENQILEYIKDHLVEIEEDMNASIKHIYCKTIISNKIKKMSNYKGKTKGSKKKYNTSKPCLLKSKRKIIGNVSKKKHKIKKNRKKRKELSVAATNKLNHHKTNIVVKFE